MTIGIHRPTDDHADIWTKLAAPIPNGAKSWRQDGKPGQRDGKYFARFVVYIDAGIVRERLDSVVPGEWNLTLELLPPAEHTTDDTACAFKARLQILGVVREDVGFGKDYKQASTDAFKRAAVRFGIGHELYEYEQNWVQMDGDGKYAKALEDPGEAYERRMAKKGTEGEQRRPPQAARAEATHGDSRESDTPSGSTASATTENPPCPKCGGRMYDNRISKRNPKAPDFKCRDRSCDGVIWPPKNGKAKAAAPAARDDFDDFNGEEDDGRPLPF